MNRKELLGRLEVASRGLGETSLVPIYKCFLFTNNQIIAFNDSIAITLPAEVGEFALHGKTLMGLLSNTGAEEVEIAIVEQDAVVKAGRSTFKLPWHKPEEFPYEIPDGPWDLTMKIDQDLLTGIRSCLVTSSRDLSKEAWCGVVIPEGKAVLYSADGDAASEYKLDQKIKSKAQFMLRNDFCTALLDMATDSGTLSINNDWAMAEIGDVCLYGRMVSVDTPLDHAKEIKATMKVEPMFVGVPGDLPAALSRARVVADQESAKTTLTVEKGRLRLVTDTSMGVVRDTLAFPKHPEVTANVSAELIERSLSEDVKLAISDRYCAFKSDKLFVLIANME